MIVAIDTLFLAKRYRRTGTGVYLNNLLLEFLRLAANERLGIEFHGFSAPNDDWATDGFVSPFLRVHKTRLLARRRCWVFGGMAFHTAAVHPDLVFLPNATGSIPGPFRPLLSTILDAMPRRLPRDLVEAGRLAPLMSWVSAKLATKIITISEWSKRDLVEVYGLDPAKIAVTYLGYDRRFYNETPSNPEASAALLRRFGIRRPFVLHHGMVQLRKNIQRLIPAFDRVMGAHRTFDAQLVLAGPLGLGHEEILQVRSASPNRNRVILTGELPDNELGMLIREASLCVIPSLYEGFCLPMVEAMACGVPTIASNSSCLPEVSGGSLEYFDPASIEAIADAIQHALEDSTLRTRLRNRGLARVAQFSWERCARETLGAFGEVHLERRSTQVSANARVAV